MSSKALARSRERKHSWSEPQYGTYKVLTSPLSTMFKPWIAGSGGAQSQSQSQVIFSRERSALLLVLRVEKAVPGFRASSGYAPFLPDAIVCLFLHTSFCRLFKWDSG